MRRVEFGEDARARFVVALRAQRRIRRFGWIAVTCALSIAALHGLGVGGYLVRPQFAEARSAQMENHSKHILAPIVAATLVSPNPCGAQAADLRVPQDYPSVQAAHDAALEGDRILVDAGIHAAEHWVITKAITIESAHGPLATVISSREKGAANKGFEIRDLPVGAEVLILGFTFIGGAENLITSGSSVLSRCRFVECGGPGSYGGALRIYSANSVRLSECAFERCRADGAGAIATFGVSLDVSRCMFLQNSAVLGGQPSEGGAMHLLDAPATIESSTFLANGATIGGAICRWWNSPTVVVSNTRFGQNSSDWNCCISCISCGAVSGDVLTMDCNSNLIPDSVELLLEPSRDLDLDGVLDSCQCRLDLIADSTVNAADMAIVLNFWGTNGSQFPGVDIDGDGIVGGSDLAAVLNAWGPCAQ